MHRSRESHALQVHDGTRLVWHEHHPAEQGDPALRRRRPLVFLSNGIGSSEHFWRPLLARLVPDYRVVHWDYRAHGESGPSATGRYDMQTHAQDAIEVAERALATGDGPAVCVGFSMGVVVTLELYRRRPDLVRGLVLVAGGAEAPFSNTLPLRVPGARALVRGWLGLAQPWMPVASPVVSAVARMPLTYHAGVALGLLQKEAPRSEVRGFLHQMSAMDLGAFWRTLRGLMASDAKDVLPTVRVPTLVLAAERDLLVSSGETEVLRSALPHARFVTMPRAGHAVLLEKGAVAAEEIAAFLHRVTSS